MSSLPIKRQPWVSSRAEMMTLEGKLDKQQFPERHELRWKLVMHRWCSGRTLCVKHIKGEMNKMRVGTWWRELTRPLSFMTCQVGSTKHVRIIEIVCFDSDKSFIISVCNQQMFAFGVLFHAWNRSLSIKVSRFCFEAFLIHILSNDFLLLLHVSASTDSFLVCFPNCYRTSAAGSI